MKLKAEALANALAMVSAGYYLVCLILSYTFPAMLSGMFQSWAHMMRMERVMGPVRLGGATLIWGLVTFTGLAWITGYVLAAVYNKMVKK